MIYTASVSLVGGTQIKLIVEANNRSDAERIAQAETSLISRATVIEVNVVPVQGSAYVYDIMETK